MDRAGSTPGVNGRFFSKTLSARNILSINKSFSGGEFEKNSGDRRGRLYRVSSV